MYIDILVWKYITPLPIQWELGFLDVFFSERSEEQKQKTSEFLKDLWLNLLHRTLASINFKDLIVMTLWCNTKFHIYKLDSWVAIVGSSYQGTEISGKERLNYEHVIFSWHESLDLSFFGKAHEIAWKGSGRCHRFVWCFSLLCSMVAQVKLMDSRPIYLWSRSTILPHQWLLAAWFCDESCVQLAMCHDVSGIGQGWVLEPSLWSQHLLLRRGQSGSTLFDTYLGVCFELMEN